MAEQQKYNPVSQGADGQHAQGYTVEPAMAYAGGGVMPPPPPPPGFYPPQQGYGAPVQTEGSVFMQPATGTVTMQSGPPPPFPPPGVYPPQQGYGAPVQPGVTVVMQPTTGMVTMQSGPPPPPPSPNPCFAIWLGVFATICCAWPCGIPAIILGLIAWQQPQSSSARLINIIGVVLGCIGCGLVIIFILSSVISKVYSINTQDTGFTTDCVQVYSNIDCYSCKKTWTNGFQERYYSPVSCEKAITTTSWRRRWP